MTNPQDIAQWLLTLTGKYKKSGSGYQFKCPAHGDKSASASLKIHPDGVGFRCFAGCTTDEICAALGVQKSDLFVKGNGVRSSGILRTYKYFDDDGQLLFQHHRMIQRSKTDAKFLWQRFDEAGNAIWSLGQGWFELRGNNWKRVKDADHDDALKSPKAGARWFDAAPPRPLYHRSRLKDAAPGSLVLWNEGEKDAETAETRGMVAVTAGGAQDWQARYADDLAGFDLVVIADNDDAGRCHAAKVAADCYGKVARLRVIDSLPGVAAKGDLTDWLAMGHTRADLVAVIESIPDYVPNGEAVEDEATAVTIEPDDAPLSDDPKIDERVRRIAFNAAKVNMAVTLIMRKLGFKADHARLTKNLASIKPGHLGTIVCVLKWLADVYGMSVDTVSRDIQKLLDEQKQLGVEVLDYIPGTKNPATGQGYGSKFRRGYLRLALRAIAVAIETQGDLEYSHDALNRACDEVVRGVERTPVEVVVKVEGDSETAEKRAKGEIDKAALMAKFRMKSALAMKRMLQAMSDEGLDIEDAELILSDAFNDATDAARERIKAQAEHDGDLTAAEPTGATANHADHLETIEGHDSLSLNTIKSTPQDGAESANPYSLQDADYMAQDENRSAVTKRDEFGAKSGQRLAAEDYYEQDLKAGRAGPAPPLPFEQEPEAFIDSQCDELETMATAVVSSPPATAALSLAEPDQGEVFTL